MRCVIEQARLGHIARAGATWIGLNEAGTDRRRKIRHVHDQGAEDEDDPFGLLANACMNQASITFSSPRPNS